MQSKADGIASFGRGRTCENCGGTSRDGKFGDKGSEYANQWYCNTCWQSWEEYDRAGVLPSTSAPSTQHLSDAARGVKTVAERCGHCGQESSYGRMGLADGDATSRWYCRACHDSWEGLADQRPGARSSSSRPSGGGPATKCSREGCLYAKHSTLGHSFCCFACLEDRGHHSSACEKIFSEEALGKLSPAELRVLGGDRGIALDDCIEKEDLVSRLLRSSAGGGSSGRATRASASTAAGGGGGGGAKALEAMSILELTREARSLGVDTRGCVERADLVERLREAGHFARASSGPEDPLSHGEPGLIEECEPGAEQANEAPGDSDSDGVEEIDMEAAWRAQRRRLLSASTEPQCTACHPPGAGVAAAVPPCSSSAVPLREPDPVQAPPAPPEPPPRKPISLRAAVKAGDVEAAREALARLDGEAKAALEATDGSGQTLLHLCASQAAGDGCGQLVRSLLEHAALPDARDAKGLTPLALAVGSLLDAPSAAWAGGLDAILALLKAGATPLASRTWRSSQCALGSGYGSPAASRASDLLLDFGADLPWHPRSLRSATEAGDADAAEEALERLGDRARLPLQETDHGGGRTLLHLCAERATEAGSARTAAMLLHCSARVDLCDSAGRTPLSIAVSVAIDTEEERQVAAEGTVMALLAGGVPPGVAAEWRPQDSALAKAASNPVVNSIAEYLLEAGVDLPWHPLSLHESAAAGDLQAVVSALERLGQSAQAALLAGAGPDGRTALHLCAAGAAARSDAGKIVQMLLERSARAEACDAAGCTPMALAAEAALACTGDLEAAAPALEVLGLLLASAPVPPGKVEEWYSDASTLAEMAGTSPGREVARLLKAHGAHVPWYDQLLRFQAQCDALSIPLETIGRAASTNVLHACEQWQGMLVKELRMECQARRLETDGCVEKSEMQRVLRQARVREELAIAEDPESRLLGTWCYTVKRASREYILARDDAGQLLFDGPHATMGRVSGLLAPQEDGSFLALLASNEVEVGQICLTYCERDRTMLSSYKGVAMVVWGREFTAFKEPPPAPRPAPEAPAAEASAREAADGEAEKAEPAQAAEAAEAKVPDIDIDEAEDFTAAFMAAVERHDLRSVQRGLERARREEGSAEDLVCLVDADANSALHRCCLGPLGRTPGTAVVARRIKAGPKIVALLVEAQADANDANVLGETPLLLAVRSLAGTSLGLVNALLAAGGEPDAADFLVGETALMEAAYRGDVEVCQALLEAKADPSKKNSEGLTARDIAAENDHSHVARLLRTVCPTADDEELLRRAKPLWDAVEASDLEAVQSALDDFGADVQTVVDLRGGIDCGGRTLLHVCAASSAHDNAGEVARVLLEAGASLDRGDIKGRTALELAVSGALALEEGHWAAMDVIRVLLVAGASTTVAAWREPRGELARAWHDSLGSATAICRLLRSFGADLPWYGKPPPTDMPEAFSDEEFAEAEPEPAPRGEAPRLAEPLLAARCEECGIPLSDLGREGAEGVLQKCERWRQMRVEDLRAECEREGIPTTGCVEKRELEARLQQARIWQELPEKVLEKECAMRGISLAFDFVQRSTKEEALKQHEWGAAACGRVQKLCKEKGIPFERLDLERATEILQQIEHLEAKKIADLKDDFVKEGLALEAGMEKSEMFSRLKDILIWKELPVTALISECRQKGLQVGSASQEALIHQLKVSRGWTLAAPSRFSGFFSYKTDQGAKEKEQEAKQKEQQEQREREQQQDARDFWFGDKNARGEAWTDWAQRNAGDYHTSSHFPGFPGAPRGQRQPRAQQQPRRNPYTGFNFNQQRSSNAPPPQPKVSPGIDKHFRTLGLSTNATKKEVKNKYKELCLKFHPDKNQGSEEAERRFKEVGAAYDELCKYLKETCSA